jgi:hypothetical protein
MLADQTIRAIQPMKCFGAKCAIPTSPIMNGLEAMQVGFTQEPSYNSFMFKQNNLRGNQ